MIHPLLRSSVDFLEESDMSIDSVVYQWGHSPIHLITTSPYTCILLRFLIPECFSKCVCTLKPDSSFIFTSEQKTRLLMSGYNNLCGNVIWASWRHMSTATRLFVHQLFIGLTSKQTSRANIYGHFQDNPQVISGFPSQRAIKRKSFPCNDVIMECHNPQKPAFQFGNRSTLADWNTWIAGTCRHRCRTSP